MKTEQDRLVRRLMTRLQGKITNAEAEAARCDLTATAVHVTELMHPKAYDQETLEEMRNFAEHSRQLAVVHLSIAFAHKETMRELHAVFGSRMKPASDTPPPPPPRV